MVRTVTRLVRSKTGAEMAKFCFYGMTSGQAALQADRLKFNIEHDRGLHKGTGKYPALNTELFEVL